LWLHSLKVAQLLRSAACLHTNQSRSYLNHLVLQNTERPSVENFLKINFNIFVAPKPKVFLQRIFYFIFSTPPSSLLRVLCQLTSLVASMNDNNNNNNNNKIISVFEREIFILSFVKYT